MEVRNINNITMNSVIILEIDVSKASSDSPDLSILRNQFNIYGVSNSSQTSIVNGSITSKKSLIISLSAKQTGKQTIPAITIGNDQTAPVQINVNPGNNSVNQGNDPQSQQGGHQQAQQKNNGSIILEALASTNKTYVDTPFVYKIKLYFNVPMNNVNMENISIANAQIEPYGKTEQYQERYQNQEYMVVEQKFIVTPTSGGVLHIPPAKLGGYVQDGQNPMGNPFISGTQFVRTSKALDINVLAKPANITTKEFFPAKAVTVSDKWSIADNTTVEIGTPITHTITITATGAALSNFPIINESQLNGFSYYEDKGTSDTKVVKDDIITSKTYKFTLIPKESGNYVFKPQAIKWLNIKTESLETIELPPKTFTVNADRNQVDDETASTPTTDATISSNAKTNTTSIIIIAIVIILCLSIIGYVIIAFRKRHKHNQLQWQNITNTLKVGNNELLVQQIIQYVNQISNKHMLTLEDVAKHFNSEKLAEFAKNINQAKYKNESFNNFDALVNEINNLCNKKVKDKKNNLKDFYPK